MLPTAVRKLSCNSVVREVARHLHVTHLARRVYCRLLSSSGDLQVSCLGADVVFRTHNSKQLAFVDYILTTERDLIEAALCDLKAGDTFLDVGSHYGIFSVLASKLVGPSGRVIAVEPHLESLQVLRQNLAANHCQNVEVLNVALSDTTGPMQLAYNEYCAGPQRPSDPASAVHTAQGIAGDEVLRNSPIPKAVKIDVEGHEFSVLFGLKQTLSNPACRRLCLEAHPTLLPPSVNQDSIKRFIRNCGFSVLNESDRSPAIHILATR